MTKPLFASHPLHNTPSCAAEAEPTPAVVYGKAMSIQMWLGAGLAVWTWVLSHGTGWHGICIVMSCDCDQVLGIVFYFVIFCANSAINYVCCSLTNDVRMIADQLKSVSV